MSDSAEATSRKSVPLIAAGDSAKYDSASPPAPGEKIADAVIDSGGAGDPKDRLRSNGDSRGGPVPLGFGENIAEAVIATGEEASPGENGRDIFPSEPADGGVHGKCWQVRVTGGTLTSRIACGFLGLDRRRVYRGEQL